MQIQHDERSKERNDLYKQIIKKSVEHDKVKKEKEEVIRKSFNYKPRGIHSGKLLDVHSYSKEGKRLDFLPF